MNFIITLLKGHIAKFLNGIHSDKCKKFTIYQSYNKSPRDAKSQTGHCHIPLSQGSGTIMEQRTEDCNNQRLDRTSAK